MDGALDGHPWAEWAQAEAHEAAAEAGVGEQQVEPAGDQHLVHDQLEQPQEQPADGRAQEHQEHGQRDERRAGAEVGNEPPEQAP